MSDLINRESLKQRINLNYNNHQHIDAQTMKDIINTEPTVEDNTVEELEKIKSEILFSELDNVEYMVYWKALNHCCEIVDKHISKLKGEQNEN